jgi:hydrogenase maturation protease
MKTLVLGIGNPILGDDGFGWNVIEVLRSRFPGDGVPELELDCCAVGGLELVERLAGYDRCILIDAVHAPSAVPGRVSRCHISQGIPQTVNQAHGLTFSQALTLASRLSILIPEDITLYTIEITEQMDFTEVLSPAVAESLAAVVQSVSFDLETELARRP